MEIRGLLEADATAWWGIRLESLEREPLAFGKAAEEHRATAVAEMAERFRDAPDTDLYLGAFEDGRLIGMITFIRDKPVKERHKGHIYGVYVTSTHQGKGIGRALLTRLLEHARHDPSLEQILLAVATTQVPAQKMYRSFGFETFGREPRALKVGTTYVDEEHMIKMMSRGNKEA